MSGQGEVTCFFKVPLTSLCSEGLLTLLGTDQILTDQDFYRYHYIGVNGRTRPCPLRQDYHLRTPCHPWYAVVGRYIGHRLLGYQQQSADGLIFQR